MNDTNSQSAELNQKLAIERKVLSGASAMLGKLVDENARQTCQVSVIDSQRRIDFLESELAKLFVSPIDSQVSNLFIIYPKFGGVGVTSTSPQASNFFNPRRSSMAPNTPEPEKRPSTNLFGSLLSQLKTTSPHTSAQNSPRASQTSIDKPEGEFRGKSALDFMRFGSDLTTVCCYFLIRIIGKNQL
jgi:hypothetical protein